MFEADIQAAIDRQLMIERKAAAWDRLLLITAHSAEHETGRVVPVGELLEIMQRLVHPAQTLSTSEVSVTQDAWAK